MNDHDKNKIKRNVTIFYVGTLLLSIAGGVVMASGQDAGGLLFILGPLLMVLVARFLLGDGWGDAGLKLNLAGNWGWYLFAIFGYFIIFPLLILITVGLGFTQLTVSLGDIGPILLGGFAIQLAPRMLYALSEEWAWRGYLEPKLQKLGFPSLQRHLFVAVLWGVWHFPLILSTDYTTTPYFVFLPLFMLGIVPTAIIWGQMRERTDSVWPVVLMHGVANTLGYAILEGNMITFETDIFGSIGTGNIILTILWGAMAYWVWQKRLAEKRLAIA